MGEIYMANLTSLITRKQNYTWNSADIINARDSGFEECKEKVLKILSKPLKNLDLSEDYCDERYIDKIKDL